MTKVAFEMSNSELELDLDLTGKVKKSTIYYAKNGEFSDLWPGEVVVRTKKCDIGTKVAIKQLRGAPAHNRDLHKETARKLNNRASTWSQLQNDNVLQFYGILYDVGYLPALVSPFCENGNVLEFLGVKRLETKQTLSIIYEVSCGLQYLHAQKVVHGDLRAVNILINDEYRPVIADFGLTFVIDHGEFTTNKIAGPARWTAPEILDPPEEDDAEPQYSFSSDIFAFGMTAVEILTGKPPYSKIRNDSAVIFKILKNERPEMPENIADFLQMQTLIGMCWEQNPDSRPDANRVKMVLEEIVGKRESTTSYFLFDYGSFFMNTFRRAFGVLDDSKVK